MNYLEFPVENGFTLESLKNCIRAAWHANGFPVAFGVTHVDYLEVRGLFSDTEPEQYFRVPFVLNHRFVSPVLLAVRE